MERSETRPVSILNPQAHLFISRYLVIDFIRWHLFSESTGFSQWNAHGRTHPFRSLFRETQQIQRCGVSSLEQSGRSYSCKDGTAGGRKELQPCRWVRNFGDMKVRIEVLICELRWVVCFCFLKLKGPMFQCFLMFQVWKIVPVIQIFQMFSPTT